MKRELSLSPKMMEQLKKDEAVQIKGGSNSKVVNINCNGTPCKINVYCKK